MNKDLIYGKDPTERIVSIEPGEGEATVFRQLEDGTIVEDKVPHTYWMLFTENDSPKFKRLNGDQPYKYIMEYNSRDRYQEILREVRASRIDHWVCHDFKEMHMVKEGRTYYKGMKVEELGVLSFDIEDTYGITRKPDGQILLISNVFRSPSGSVEKKLFCYDEFNSQADMLIAWCDWVREKNPSIVLGHNIYGYDFQILLMAAEKNGVELNLGRDGSALKFDTRYDRKTKTFIPKTNKKRKDGSQAYDFVNYQIYGREIVDTFFLALSFDIARNYPSYGLKKIIEFEISSLKAKKKKKKKWKPLDQQFLDRLTHKGNRTFYDAGKIWETYKDPEEWIKIKAYGADDADDALTLFDLMSASFFYYTQSIPRSFQNIINSASGSQINSMIVRGYLQDGKSVAKGDPKEKFEGAISFGIPGIHKNVFKIDVASLYPSIMLQYRIYNPEKDPDCIVLKILDYFTTERLINKKKAAETGDRFFDDLQAAMKIIINSIYGFMGAGNLNYNFMEGAAKVTRYGREILMKAIKWATGKDMAQVLPSDDEDSTFDEVDDCA